SPSSRRIRARAVLLCTNSTANVLQERNTSSRLPKGLTAPHDSTVELHHSYRQPRDADGRRFIPSLTPAQERAIRACIAAGFSTRRTAKQLGVSHMTVSRYARAERAQEGW